VCGRYTVVADPAVLAERFALAALPRDLEPRYNVAPSQDVLAVVARSRGPELRELRWGLVPRWSRDASGGARMINLRSETLEQRAAFARLLARNRCLILADGFYEWRTDPDGRRRPLRFTLAGEQPFAFAGLWSTWEDPEAEVELATCTILTTGANEVVAPVHDRMPVLLERAAEATWLDVDAPLEALRPLLVPYDARAVRAAEASLLVNSPDNDGPELLDPLAGASTADAPDTLF
jgi:putative SOS response-associated peptidase YedK